MSAAGFAWRRKSHPRGAAEAGRVAGGRRASECWRCVPSCASMEENAEGAWILAGALSAAGRLAPGGGGCMGRRGTQVLRRWGAARSARGIKLSKDGASHERCVLNDRDWGEMRVWTKGGKELSKG